MRKKCPYCGCENEAEVVKFCQACGREIPENSGFEYDFGGQQQTAPYANFTPTPESNYIPLNIENKKANKMKNNVFGWSIFFIVIGILRFISILSGMSDVSDLQVFLDTQSMSSQLRAVLERYVSMCYVDVAVTLVLLVMCILLVVFVVKTKKINFPVSVDSVFGLFKKNFIISAVLLVCTLVYFVMEIAVVVVTVQAYNAIDQSLNLMQIAMLGGSFAGDILLIVGAIICTVQSKKLANCRR